MISGERTLVETLRMMVVTTEVTRRVRTILAIILLIGWGGGGSQFAKVSDSVNDGKRDIPVTMNSKTTVT